MADPQQGAVVSPCGLYKNIGRRSVGGLVSTWNGADARQKIDMAQAMERALSQLRERDYAAQLRQAGAAPLHQLALVFDGKQVHVTTA